MTEEQRDPAGAMAKGRRLALLIATARYEDATLRALRTPASDVESLAAVLGDAEIGAFIITTVVDQPALQIRIAVEDFLADRRTADVLLLYLSCHGLLDARRRLFFAGLDTRKDRLAATGVEARWILDQLDACRARSQVVILDCCFSGAFAAGAKGAPDLDVGLQFQDGGRGRFVLTASRATEYSFEGHPVPGAAMPGSIFTEALVQGLRTGDADTDADGLISVDDAYDYAFDRVTASSAEQTPQRSAYGVEGDILLARVPGVRGNDAPTVRSATRTPVGRTEPPLRSTSRRWKSPARLIAASLVAAGFLVLVVTQLVWPYIQLNLRPGGTATPSGSSGSPSVVPAESGTITAVAPWRVKIVNPSSNGLGCVVTAKYESGETVMTPRVYATATFQVQTSGSIAWSTDARGCIPQMLAGAGQQTTPFSVTAREGLSDTKAFAPRSAVRVEVSDFAGNSTCDVVLRDAWTGSAISDHAFRPGDPPADLPARGYSSGYLAGPLCGLVVTPH